MSNFINENSGKLCPFKRGTVKRWTATIENNDQPNMYDVLMPCDGERCMAYRDGECRKLPPSEVRYNPRGGQNDAKWRDYKADTPERV